MTHEIMQFIVVGFIAAILLFYVYSAITSKKHKKKQQEKCNEVRSVLQEYQNELAKLDEAKVVLSERYRNNPFPHLKELHEELVSNMEASAKLISKMAETLETHRYLSELEEYDVHLQGYMETFKKQDAYFKELLTKLSHFIQTHGMDQQRNQGA